MIIMWSYNYTNPDILEHYGILGMKWGIRRFQDKKDRYIFVLVPKNYDEKKDLGFVDNYHAVYKDTGEVSGFAPWNETDFFDMLLEQGGD